MRQQISSYIALLTGFITVLLSIVFAYIQSAR
jgi:hypothetical protein